MSERPRRNITRIDYAALHGDGFVQPLESPEVEDSDDTTVSEAFETASSGVSDTTCDTLLDTTLERTFVGGSVATMSTQRILELTVELKAIFFQLDEIAEDVEDELGTKSLREVMQLHDKLKALRLSMVKLNQEFIVIDPNTHSNPALSSAYRYKSTVRTC